MKERIVYSKASWVLTIVLTAALVGGLVCTVHEPAGFFSILFIVICLYPVALFYAPVSITANDNEITIHSLLNKRSIAMSEVVKVENPFKPLPGTIRIWASGGFMGYWGKFRDSKTGSYIGYWGNGNDCFMLTLANGKKYLLGCQNSNAMAAYIEQHIKTAE